MFIVDDEYRRTAMEYLRKYYSEERLKEIEDIVIELNNPVLDFQLGEKVLEELTYKDRDNCLLLAVVKGYHHAELNLIELMEIMRESDLYNLKYNLYNQTLDEYFKDFTKADFLNLRKTISNDGIGGPAYLQFEEKKILTSVVDYYRTDKKYKIFKKKNKKIGCQNISN